MSSIFGHQRVTKSDEQLASSQYAIIVLGTSINLGANFTAQVQQEVQPFLPIGEPSVYFVRGQSQGSVAVEALVGADGFFAAMRSGGSVDCGRIKKLSLTLKGGQCSANVSGGLKFDGGIIRSAGVQLREGNLTIRQSMEILVADMQVE